MRFHIYAVDAPNGLAESVTRLKNTLNELGHSVRIYSNKPEWVYNTAKIDTTNRKGYFNLVNDMPRLICDCDVLVLVHYPFGRYGEITHPPKDMALIQTADDVDKLIYQITPPVEAEPVKSKKKKKEIEDDGSLDISEYSQDARLHE